MAGYVRNDTPNNIATGNVINAADLDGEFDAIQAAFVNTTGHTHDGTAAEGAPITKIGPTQDIVASASALTPKTDNTVDLGSAALEYKDLYIDGTANIDSLVADTADINGGTIDGVTIGGVSAGVGTFTTLNATTVDTTNIEVTTLKAKDGTTAGSIADSTGVVTLASSVLTTTDINGGTVDGASIGASSPSTGAFTTLSASGTATLSGLTASTALALNASKEVVSVTNTGTGDNVLATSPTLTTPNLGTPSTLVLTNATGLPTSALTGTVAVANGGTGATTLTGILKGNGTSAFTAATANTDYVTSTGADGLFTRWMFQDTGWDYYDSSTTNALDYVNGSVQRWAPNTGAQTLTISNWPPSGAMGELLIQGINLGAATITWPTINWIKSDGTTTTTFSANGVTLQTSGTDWVFLWTRDAGTTIYGKVVR